jgi:hypothetical protein
MQPNDNNGRDEHGRFTPGNSGGPGRPRRAVERDYLTTLTEACPPETWQRIVERAVADAKNGDATARAWLAKYLIGDKPAALTELAIAEARGVTTDDELRDLAARREREQRHQAQLDALVEQLG